MSEKSLTQVVAILLPSGEVNYRIRDHEMVALLSHPDARLGVMVFYGYYMEQHPIRSEDPCPVCGHRGRDESRAGWGFRQTRPPVFVYGDGAFVLEKRTPSPERRDYWGNIVVDPPEWWITDKRETSALIDQRKIQWLLNDWMERNA